MFYHVVPWPEEVLVELLRLRVFIFPAQPSPSHSAENPRRLGQCRVHMMYTSTTTRSVTGDWNQCFCPFHHHDVEAGLQCKTLTDDYFTSPATLPLPPSFSIYHRCWKMPDTCLFLRVLALECHTCPRQPQAHSLASRMVLLLCHFLIPFMDHSLVTVRGLA